MEAHPLSAHQVAPAAWADTWRAHLAPFDTSAGLVTLEETIAEAACLQLEAGGRPAVGFALERTQHERGAALWIVAGAADARCGLDGFSLIEHAATEAARASGARQLVLSTVRPGLVRKLTRRGWTLAYQLRKSIACIS